MWLNGLLIVAMLAIAKCSEAELIMEAAFQGNLYHIYFNLKNNKRL